MICLKTDWRSQRLQAWATTARLHVRPYPCAPLNLRGLSHALLRSEIARALQIQTGDTLFTIADYDGFTIRAKSERIISKLTKDVDHAAYAGWMAETLRNPIEVWDRYDRGIAKRHYFSAYGHARGNVLHYVAVAVSSSGEWATAFRKSGGNAIDERREGDFLYRCY